MKKARIISREYNEGLARQLAAELKISLPVAKLLLTRNIRTRQQAERFLWPEKEKPNNPFLLTDMEKAVPIILDSLEKKEKICIYGDYDVDGITATSLLFLFFQDMGADISYRLPHRIRDGYGLNEDAIRELKERGIDLIITVDTGISAVNEVKLAKELGFKIIVTDHHECQAVLPEADAVIDPKRPDDSYPFKEIAGVGVAFKLICALTEKLREKDADFALDPYQYIELVAVGTVSDLMPLVEENRIFVKKALAKMKQTDNKGLKALLEVAGVEQDKVTSSSIGFRIGPRLNAAGRMGDAGRGVELFISRKDEESIKLAEELDMENRKRQETENEILQEALNQISEYSAPDDILVVAGQGWHHGVVGIVASRVLERYYRPVIVLAVEGDMAVGSARSIEGFNLFEALCACQDLFTKFGGHEMAAGMSLPADKIDEFRKRINQYAKERLTAEIMTRREVVDFSVDIAELNLSLLDELQLLEPYGVGNPEPKFLIEGNLSEIRQMGKENQHLRLGLRNKQGYIDGVAFFEGQEAERLYSDFPIKATGSVQINEWNGMKKPQMMLSYFTQADSIYQYSSNLNQGFHQAHFKERPALSREDCKELYLRLRKLEKESRTQLSWQEFPAAMGKTTLAGLCSSIAGITVFEELGICKADWNHQHFSFELVEGVCVELDKSKIYTRLQGIK